MSTLKISFHECLVRGAFTAVCLREMGWDGGVPHHGIYTELPHCGIYRGTTSWDREREGRTHIVGCMEESHHGIERGGGGDHIVGCMEEPHNAHRCKC